MTTRQTLAEDLVLIASTDSSSSWYSQRRSMKQEGGMLCETTEPEEIDGAHAGGVCEIVRMRDTDEMHGYFEENQSVD